jgi:hypothetical protein
MRKMLQLAFMSLFLMNAGHVGAQNIEDLIKGSKADANYLFTGYTKPLLNAFGAGLNQGWYNTAKSHKKFGVDLTISVAAVGIPSSDKFFTVDNTKLSSIELINDHNGNSVTSSGKVPTMIGPDPSGSLYRYKESSEEFDGIGGKFDIGDLPMGRMPVPVFNLGFGLPKGTDLKIRFIPSVGTDDVKLSMFGVGVMHDIKQYIPGIKLLPFDLSGFVGYTNFKTVITVEPIYNQKVDFKANAVTVQALISKKISVLTFYGGIGYNTAKVNVLAKGNYDLDGDDVPDIKDPVTVSVSQNGPRATAGMRLKLAVFTLHGDYTFQKYSTFTAGFGISVR